MASLVYFLVSALAPKTASPAIVDVSGVRIGATPDSDDVADISAGIKASKRSATVLNEAAEAISQQRAISPAKRLAHHRHWPRTGDLSPLPKARRARSGRPQTWNVEAMPRVLFALVPVFAALVALFYRRRRYPEHLYFAIHLHAFISLALVIVALTKVTRVNVLMAIAPLIARVWIPTYATLSFRRVYGGSLSATVAKEAAIGMLYAIAAGIALLATIYVVALWG